jgi:N-acetylglucosaminyl-diphospho-decaprenol L-rhamnosyltransferase
VQVRSDRRRSVDVPYDRPDLSVIVVTHNGCDVALATLRSAQANAGDVSCQWIVVDSGSTDGTPDAIEREFPEVRVIRAPNRGFAAGNNIGLTHARGRYVQLLNPDVEIERGSFADLVAALDRRPEVGIASVVQLAADGQLLASVRRFPTPARHLGEALGAARLPALQRLQELDTNFEDYRHERSVEWVVGAFMCARRDAIEQVGPLDESFFLYSEETDWCHRFRQRGWDIRHMPLMTITHLEGDTTGAKTLAQLWHSRRRYAYKHFSWPRALGIHAALVLGRLLRLLVVAPAALVQPRLRQRVRAEAFGLAVLCGAGPPYRAG